MSNFRKYEDSHPIYMTHGKGARLYDVDGNEYIDYSLSYGPAILGHSNAHIRQAIIDQIPKTADGVPIAPYRIWGEDMDASALEQMPRNSQSLTLPVPILGTLSCQTNSPVSSLNGSTACSHS